MAEVKIFDASGKQTGSEAVSEKLAETKTNQALIHQVAVAEMAGRRQGNASTLGRAEVKGSGAKIRRQKGTGRSRQGGKRNPHMRGGGVVHGPKPRSYAQATPRKMRQAAFRAVFNNRVENERVAIFGGSFDAPKTKTFIDTLGTLGWADYKLLFLTAGEDKNAGMSARNLPKVTVQSVGQTSLVDILKNEAVLCTRAAWDEMNARIEGKNADSENAEVAA